MRRQKNNLTPKVNLLEQIVDSVNIPKPKGLRLIKSAIKKASKKMDKIEPQFPDSKYPPR